MNIFKKPSPEELMEKAVTDILHTISSDDISEFSHLEQSKILNEVIVRYKDKKKRERTEAVELAKTIDESINELL